LAVATTVSGDAAVQYVDPYGSANQTTIDSGGVQYVSGVVSNTIINSGGRQILGDFGYGPTSTLSPFASSCGLRNALI